jgi:hypothetical protein
MPALCKNCRLHRFRDRMECQLHATSHGNRWNLKSSSRWCVQMTQRNCFPLQWQFARSYHCTLQGSVEEMRILICHPIMPPTTRFRLCCHENIRQRKNVNVYTVDRVHRKHETTTICNFEPKNYAQSRAACWADNSVSNKGIDDYMNWWGDWLQVVWSRRWRVLLRKWRMLVLEAFEGN